MLKKLCALVVLVTGCGTESAPKTKNLPIADFEIGGNKFSGNTFVVPADMPEDEAYGGYGWPKPKASE